MPRSKAKNKKIDLNLSPMIDVVFLILIYFIVIIQMEPTLDDILQLPPAYKSVHQEEDKLQIYVLPAKILPGGDIDPDSMGLIAFTPREPKQWDSRSMEERYIPLDSVSKRLERERDRILTSKVEKENKSRYKKMQSSMSPSEIDNLKFEMALMIKSDRNTFYGRIIQVVNQARRIGISKFAFVTSTESSEELVGPLPGGK